MKTLILLAAFALAQTAQASPCTTPNAEGAPGLNIVRISAEGAEIDVLYPSVETPRGHFLGFCAQSSLQTYSCSVSVAGEMVQVNIDFARERGIVRGNAGLSIYRCSRP